MKDVNQVFLAITAPSTAPMMKLVVAFLVAVLFTLRNCRSYNACHSGHVLS